MSINVAHIPLAYRESAPLGYYAYPAIADTIADATGGTYLPYFDQHSDQTPRVKMTEDINWLLGKELKSHVDKSEVTEMLNLLESSGLLIQKKVDIRTCNNGIDGCGSTEYQHVEESMMQYVTGSHSHENAGCCVGCGVKLQKRIVDGLVLSIQDNNPTSRVSPKYLRSNIESIHSTFAGSELLLSRTKPSKFRWEEFNIDNDISNYIGIAKLAGLESDDLLYLSGANTSFQVYIMSLIAKGLNFRLPHITALPKIHIDTSESKFDNITPDALRSAGIPADVTRLVLMFSLRSNSARFTIPSREFGGTHKRLHPGAREAIANNSEQLVDDGLRSNSDVNNIPNSQILGRVLKEMIKPTSDLSFSRDNLIAAAMIATTIGLDDSSHRIRKIQN